MPTLHQRRKANIPSPFNFSPSQFWEGNDGSWSSFILRIGTPGQTFRVLISTASQETWIPLPDGCLPTDPTNCGDLRGVQVFQNAASNGFKINQSSTWESINLYGLSLEENLNYTGNGMYGFDTIGLQIQNSGGVTLLHQIVAGIVTKDFMLGMFPLGPKPTNFSDFNDPQPSFMWTMRNQSLIPSISYGYCAGSSFRGNIGFGTLTLGGYDAARFHPNNLTFGFRSPYSGNLVVGIQAIEAENTLSGIASLLPAGILSFIDSTVPEIWLPVRACEMFETAFGLQFDSHTDRYLVNDTIHSKLMELNPRITFKLGYETYGGQNINIVLPYAAFDLQANYPIYPTATNYFPIRRASNKTQYVIGRTFLQEAYIVVDYERSNFSIFQAAFPEDRASKIIPIYPVESQNHRDFPTHGFKIGIAFAAVIFLALLAGVFFGCRRYKLQRSKRVAAAKQVAEEDELRGNELPQNVIEEVPGQSRLREMDTGLVPEIDDEERMAELPEQIRYEVSGESPSPDQRSGRAPGLSNTEERGHD